VAQENASITIAGRPYKLELPPSFVARREVLDLASVSGYRAFAAAIALCSPKAARKANVAVRGLPVDYGQAMYDALATAGAEADIPVAGRIAFQFLIDSFPSAAKVEEESGNSEAPTEPGT
jgi:hypothetical protein